MKDKQDTLREALIEAAKNARLLYYGKAAQLLGLDMAQAADRGEIGRMLDAINRVEHDEKRPLLSAVVVRATSKMPGPGFFPMARRLGYAVGDDEQDERAFWEQEVARVYSHWADRPSSNLPVPLNFSQPPLLIEHPVDGGIVSQRPRDGYINATHLCQRAGKLFADYRRLRHTEDFLEELSLNMGIPILSLVQTVRGRGDVTDGGTWVHPHVAINLGQWLSPSFAVKVSQWVFDWMSGKTQEHMPVHVQRFLKNRAKIPHTHFSMLNEIYLNLLAPLEEYGVIPPDNMMPDISTGRMFSDFLRQKGIDPDVFPAYQHEFVDSARPTVNARLYPIEYLPDFRRHFNEVWLPREAERYFRERFPKALPLLPRVGQLPSP